MRRASLWALRNLTPRRLFVVGAVLAVVVMAVRVLISWWSTPSAYDWPRLHPYQVDTLLALERTLALPSGVSPVFPLIFLAAAGIGWAVAQLNRRYVLDQVTPPGPHPPKDDSENQELKPDEKTWREALRRRQEFEEGLNNPWRLLSQPRQVGLDAPVLAAAFAFNLYLLSPVLVHLICPGTSRAPGNEDFVRIFYFLFTVLFLFLTIHWVRLVLLWRTMRTLLRLIVRLPLAQALDRLPPRVARWFHEVPVPDGGRFELVWQQAQALAAQMKDGNDPALQELAQMLTDPNDPLRRELAADGPEPYWTLLKKKLEGITSVDAPEALGLIRPILLAYWRKRPVGDVFSEAPEAAPGTTGGGAAEGLRGIALAIANQDIPKTDPPKKLPEWIRSAEDLLALVMVRWLASSLAQLWILIGFLVQGALSLLLAASSYPFPLQSRMLFGLGVLIGLIALTVASVVLGINRDELISRVGNNPSNQFKLDAHLVTSLMTYIVPLVGVFAAISFDASDTLRTLLDPILRHLK